MNPMTTGTIRRICISTPVRKPMKTSIIRFNLGCSKSVFFRDSFCCMTLRAGRHGNPSLIDWRVRINLRFNAMDAMAGGASGGISPAPGCELPMDALCELFGNFGMA